MVIQGRSAYLLKPDLDRLRLLITYCWRLKRRGLLFVQLDRLRIGVFERLVSRLVVRCRQE